MPESLPVLPIDPARFPEWLGDFRCRLTIDALPVCESTSALLLERAEQGAPSGSVVIAGQQTAGRGSRGRRWVTPPGKSLAFSLLWHFPPGLERLVGLSLAVGLAVARVLRFHGARVALKWPNDLLVDDAKLGGILIDLQENPASSLAVIGIGLNLCLPDAQDFSDFALPPTALDRFLSPLPETAPLLAALLIELVKTLDLFSARGFAPLREEWQALNAWQNRAIRLLRGDYVEKEGVCCGVDDDGALLVRTERGLERCLSGDLSLRAL